MPATRSTWDIFCTVIDNYGDIGVTWRLARQLVAEYGIAVRLWVDDLQVLQRIWPQVQSDCDEQCVAGVIVRKWRAPFPTIAPADVVIEAFACELPENYLQAMAQRTRKPLWLNLEYLSAEDWVRGCHGLPSPQSRYALDKYFFFPGFTEGTGGVLCERDLLARRRAFQRDANARTAFLARFNIAPTPSTQLISLFAYENAALPALLSSMVAADRPVLCLVPEGKLLPQVAAFFGVPMLAVGATASRGALTVAALPFLRQDDYDLLLWSCDINCVRGEDSFVRAQWAGRPFLWHIYPQAEGAHWQKLNAFLALYCADLAPVAATALTAAWHAWNGDGAMADAWCALQKALPTLSAHAEAWSDRLARQRNLAAALAQFCANHV